MSKFIEQYEDFWEWIGDCVGFIFGFIWELFKGLIAIVFLLTMIGLAIWWMVASTISFMLFIIFLFLINKER